MEEVENETDKVQSVMEAFQRYDQDGDGMINFKELAALMRDLAGSAGDWDDHQIRVLLKAMDSDNDGKVILTEFGAWLFGSQLSDEDESKLKTAELKLATGTEKAEGRSNAGNGGESKLSKIRSGTSGTSGEGGTSEKRDKERDKTAWRPGRRLPEGAEQGDDEEEEEVEEDEEDEDGDAEEEEEEPEDPEEPEEDWEEFDEKMFNKLSQSGRSALWQRLMPAREGSAQDAAQRMKSLKPPNPKRPNDHKHALLYLQNHAGGNADLAGQPPDGADRKKALQWLKDALLKISEAHDKSYQLPVKWLIGNWRLWPDEDEGDSKKDPGFVDLKNLAIRKLDGIGKKYEDLYKERKLGMELGFIGENLTFEIRPRQDHYLVPPGYFGLKELHDSQIAHNLDRDQQQELSFYYSRSGLISVEDTGILTTLTSLEYAGMISWEDVGRLTEGLRQIHRLDLVKLLTEFEMKRNLTILLDCYTRERLGLDLCFRSDSVQSTAAYLLMETARDGFDITNVRSLVGSGKNIKKVLNEFEEEIDRSEFSFPWSKLAMLIVIAGEIIVAASANGKHHQNHQLMEMCFTAAEECSSRMMPEQGSWQEFCYHVEERFKLVWYQQESDPSSLLVKKEIADVVQKLKESSFFQ